jgi:hypothetical protein
MDCPRRGCSICKVLSLRSRKSMHNSRLLHADFDAEIVEFWETRSKNKS